MAEIDQDLAAIIQSRVGRSVCGGRYSIERVIGIGGMAAVYAGSHRNGRPVALKFLHPEFSRRADIRKRFIREGQAANAVQHPGIVAVIDDDVAEDGAAFLVMERLEGKSLEQLWEDLGRRFPTRAVLAIARELCDVLAVAHRAGIYHRDLKPENLFLTDEGKLKVLDFGLAHLRDATRPKDTHTGMVFGTPAFMPPEQASGQTSRIDARTDIWAVGATLFTLLSGELVHQGETAQHFVVLAAMEPARSLAAVMPHAHPSLVQIVDRALAREKEARWQSAESMREAICSAMELLLGDDETSLPTPIGLTEMVGRQKRRPESPLKTDSASDDPTTLKVAAIELEETLSDATRVDTNVASATDSGPDTEPNAIKPLTGGSSDTPTEQTTPDELPTQVQSPDVMTVKRQSERTPVDAVKRASWSDLRRAIAERPSARAVEAARVNDETQLLAQTAPTDRTQILGRNYRPSSSFRAPAPSAPAFAMPQDRASYPAPVPVPRAARSTMSTRKPGSRVKLPYWPLIGASFLLGLSPLAYVVARNCGEASGDANTQTPPAISVSTPLPPRVVSARVESRPSVIVPIEPLPDPSVPDAARVDRPVSSLARPPSVSPPLPSGRRSVDCATPFVLDGDGIKHWKPQCL